MRIRRLVTMGAVTLVAALGAAPASAALPGQSHGHEGDPPGHARAAIPSDSLRSLAAAEGLRIGTAVNTDLLGSNATYTGIVEQQFSTVTPENVMKWEVVEPTRGHYDWSAADQLVSFAEQHGQLVRGHTLMWHNQLPPWITTDGHTTTLSDTELKAVLKKHVMDEVGHFKGQIWQWDVANEVFADPWTAPADVLPNGMNGGDFWISHLGPGIVDDVFRWAHQADPHTLLFYNDYNTVNDPWKFQNIYDWAKGAIARGVPIDGIGEQGHLATMYGFDSQGFRSRLQQLGDLGLDVAITEADVRTPITPITPVSQGGSPTQPQVPTDSLATSAQPYEFSEELKACQLVRQCISFTAWGVDDGNSWIPQTSLDNFPAGGEGYALLYDPSYQPKSAYYALQDDLKLAAGVPYHATGKAPGWR